jgi:integrase
VASIVRVGTRWRALVRRKGHRSYCKTFGTKAAAEAWAREVELELDKGRAPEQIRAGELSVAALLDAYERLRESGARPIEATSSEFYQLKHLRELLGKHKAGALQIADLVAWAKLRLDEGASPATINQDLGKLGTAWRYACSYLAVTLPDVVGQSRPMLAHLRLIGPSKKRTRRPDEDELARLLLHLETQYGRIYADAVAFAAASTLRRAEVCRIVWADVDRARRLVLVRDRKDPRRKQGNDVLVPLLEAAWQILEAQPRSEGEPRCFPIHPQTLSKYVKESTRELGIPDLRLHDMRHEGTSRLFEQGFEIPEVALVTGHKKWENLQRYTQLSPADLVRKKKKAPEGA